MPFITDKWSSDRADARKRLNYRFQFKDPVMNEKFIEYCKYKKLTALIFVMGIICMGVYLPTVLITLYYDNSWTEVLFSSLMAILFALIGLLSLIIGHTQIANKSYFDRYLSTSQSLFIMLTAGLAMLVPAGYVLLTDCSHYPFGIRMFLVGWHCDTTPSMDILPFYVINPIIQILALNEPRVDLILVNLLCSNTAYLLYNCYYGTAHDILVILGWTVIAVLVTMDMHIVRVMHFLTYARLQETLNTKERMEEETRINELRHMIGNIAHDLKTVSIPLYIYALSYILLNSPTLS